MIRPDFLELVRISEVQRKGTMFCKPYIPIKKADQQLTKAIEVATMFLNQSGSAE